MTQPLRSCSNPALELYFLNRSISEFPGLEKAELFTFTLADGITIHRWTSWDSDLTFGGNQFSSRQPWLKRTRWNVTNTMQVPEIEVRLLALNASFNGGADIKTQIRNGLFRGATFLLQDLYRWKPTPDTWADLGTTDIFGGSVAGVTIKGAEALITVRGKNNLLDRYSPRNVYQTGCVHTFCDVGCTLNRATFTNSFTIGASPTAIFIPWAAAPGNPSLYVGGEVIVTSGEAAGQTRDVAAADGTGLTLEYPLYDLPAAGRHLRRLSRAVTTPRTPARAAAARIAATKINFLGFPFVPPPTTAY
jgi:hypothetical protein